MARTDPTTGSVVWQPPTRAVTLRRIVLAALLSVLVPGTSLAQPAGDSVVEAARRVFRHNLRLLHRHGGRLAVGSDGYGSLGVSEAMQLHDLGVFTNRELLTTWVETTPRTIFPHRKIGRLAPGYEASFLVLEGNPLEDFSATQEIVLRVKRGMLLSPLPTGPVNLRGEVSERQPGWARARPRSRTLGCVRNSDCHKFDEANWGIRSLPIRYTNRLAEAGRIIPRSPSNVG